MPPASRSRLKLLCAKPSSGFRALLQSAFCRQPSPTKSLPRVSGRQSSSASAKAKVFVASDVPGILHHTRNVYFLADGDMAILTPAGVKLTDFDGRPIERNLQRIAVGSHPGRKRRLQALHAQGNLGAATRRH